MTVEDVPFVREPSPLRDLQALRATIQLIRRLRPDIVNASTPKAGLLGMIAARACRVPVRVYVVRGFRFETATGWRRRLLRWLERVAGGAANHVVFNSHSLMVVGERVGVVGADRGEVIGAGSGNGIDIERFADEALPSRDDARRQLGVPTDAVVVGFVGRFTHDKGIADLMRVIDSLRAARPELHLLLVGQFEDGDPVPPDVRAAIVGSDHVTVVPWLEHTGVAYRAMDVLAFPSYREGLPNAAARGPAVSVFRWSAMQPRARSTRYATERRVCWCRPATHRRSPRPSPSSSTIPPAGPSWAPWAPSGCGTRSIASECGTACPTSICGG